MTRSPDRPVAAPFSTWRRLQKKAWKASPPVPWTTVLIPRLTMWLLKHCYGPGTSVEVLGPQGLCNRVTLRFRRKEWRKDRVLWLEPELHHPRLYWQLRYFDREPSRPNRDTIADLNGMTYPREDVPARPTPDWFLQRAALVERCPDFRTNFQL